MVVERVIDGVKMYLDEETGEWVEVEKTTTPKKGGLLTKLKLKFKK